MNGLRQRCIELLADRATRDLDDDRRRELNAILHQHPEWDDDSYELVAAALDLAIASEASTMPGSVRQRLAQTSRSWLQNRGNDA
jgi:hypothetical protein